MTQALVDMVGAAFSMAAGSALILGIIVFGAAMYFIIKNRLDRGGIALILLLTAGFLSAPLPMGFAILDYWVYYIILAIVAIVAGLGFVNMSRVVG